MSQKLTTIVVVLFVVLIGLSMSLFTVKEGQSVIMMRLGKILLASGQLASPDSSSDQSAAPLLARVYHPGLHFKLPLVDQILRFDTRLQTMNVQSSRILTAEQKYVLVDYFAKWRIANLSLYYKRTGGFSERAETLLSQKINDALRAEFGRHTITEVISGERMNIMALLLKKAQDSAKGLGVQVVDVRIKRIDLPKEVSGSVFDRMRTEREQVATQHRSDGKAMAEKIRAQADAKATVIVATAKEKSAQIKAQGLAVAAKIYAIAYGKDPSFYRFLRSMKLYEKTFNQRRDFLVLSPNNQALKYFNQLK